MLVVRAGHASEAQVEKGDMYRSLVLGDTRMECVDVDAMTENETKEIRARMNVFEPWAEAAQVGGGRDFAKLQR
ncbi:hypothetical protein Clacol_004289 [Clathrus columnatus]|uniref:Uncharacterized protein n=1 Tax=Clathrus columnatus TaxID=1419009 RepID=A0AAV5ABQ3_9AGAM|nr:hypothetical protein Clacol_004289 [Clathrus columnatus]